MLPNAKLTAVDAAFPASVAHLMPKYEDIPKEFKRPSNKWVMLTEQWFFSGIKGAVFTPKDGINTDAALRHIRCILGSFEPQHEHKEAAVAFLLSEWFSDVTVPTPVKGTSERGWWEEKVFCRFCPKQHCTAKGWDEDSGCQPNPKWYSREEAEQAHSARAAATPVKETP